MPSKYSLIQLSPDEMSYDERVTIGVLTFDKSGECQVRFLQEWSRVEAFAGHDVGYVFEFIGDLRNEAQHGIEYVELFMGKWENKFHLTEPHASTRSVDDLAESTEALFLRPKVVSQAHDAEKQMLAKTLIEIHNLLPQGVHEWWEKIEGLSESEQGDQFDEDDGLTGSEQVEHLEGEASELLTALWEVLNRFGHGTLENIVAPGVASPACIIRDCTETPATLCLDGKAMVCRTHDRLVTKAQ